MFHNKMLSFQTDDAQTVRFHMQHWLFTWTGIPYRSYKVGVHSSQSAQGLSMLNGKQDIPNTREHYK